MQMHPIDVAIIIWYLVIIVLAGFILSKRASKNLDAYFLGDKSIPWYILGISNASSMFDITGTMLLIYFLFAYGVKSVWLPWMWPTFNQIFLMIYISIWLRRSNVLTGAEWIQTRFGNDKGVIQREGLAPNDDVGELANELDALGRDVMIVGHLPFLSKLASALIIGSETANAVAFKNGGVVSISRGNDNLWQLAWLITPELLS